MVVREWSLHSHNARLSLTLAALEMRSSSLTSKALWSKAMLRDDWIVERCQLPAPSVAKR